MFNASKVTVYHKRRFPRHGSYCLIHINIAHIIMSGDMLNVMLRGCRLKFSDRFAIYNLMAGRRLASVHRKL